MRAARLTATRFPCAMMPLRILRAAVFAMVSSVLGAVAHVVGGGSVSPVSALSALGVAFLPALALAGRERPPVVILATLAGVQVALHLVLSTAHALEPLVGPAGHSHAGSPPGLGMLLMHGWAVGLTALWLSRGEAVLWALLRRLAVRLRIVLLAVFADASDRRPVPVPAGPPRPCRSALLGHEMGRRGPPSPSRTLPA